MDVFKEYADAKEIGLGVVNPRSDEVEDASTIVSRVKAFLRYFSPDKLYLNPDCGFGTFAERSLNTPEISFQKLKAIKEGAEVLREQYSLSSTQRR